MSTKLKIKFSTLFTTKDIYFKVFQPKNVRTRKEISVMIWKPLQGVLVKVGDLSGVCTHLSYLQLTLASWRVPVSNTASIDPELLPNIKRSHAYDLQS